MRFILYLKALILYHTKSKKSIKSSVLLFVDVTDYCVLRVCKVANSGIFGDVVSTPTGFSVLFLQLLQVEMLLCYSLQI